MGDEEPQQRKKKTEKAYPTQILAEDMQPEWSAEAVKFARDAFALSIPSGDVHASIADYIRKKFERERNMGPGWNCIVGRSFGAYVTHEIKTYIYFSVHPGTYVLLWKS